MLGDGWRQNTRLTSELKSSLRDPAESTMTTLAVPVALPLFCLHVESTDTVGATRAEGAGNAVCEPTVMRPSAITDDIGFISSPLGSANSPANSLIHVRLFVSDQQWIMLSGRPVIERPTQPRCNETHCVTVAASGRAGEADPSPGV
jgi:hypothetical protein